MGTAAPGTGRRRSAVSGLTASGGLRRARAVRAVWGWLRVGVIPQRPGTGTEWVIRWHRQLSAPPLWYRDGVSFRLACRVGPAGRAPVTGHSPVLGTERTGPPLSPPGRSHGPPPTPRAPVGPFAYHRCMASAEHGLCWYCHNTWLSQSTGH